VVFGRYGNAAEGEKGGKEGLLGEGVVGEGDGGRGIEADGGE
jgi:hypothetical protein